MFIKRICRAIYYDIIFLFSLPNIIYKLKFNKEKVILYGTPDHSNLGDQAQTLCIKLWSEENISSKVFISLKQCKYKHQLKILISIIEKYITDYDVIFCHSGYHFTELYPLYLHYYEIIKYLKNNKIVIFPQTINFKNESNYQLISDAINSHNDCTLMCRDKISYQNALFYFNRENLLLFPDIVTMMIGNHNNIVYDRNGILFCLRNDEEAMYKSNDIKKIIFEFEDIKYEITDTTLNIKSNKIIKDRQKYFDEIIDYFSRFRFIITDRYHGIIFSLISGTPVIVLSTIDHKLTSGLEWFNDELFYEYIFFANNIEEAKEILNKRINISVKGNITPYFKIKYFDKLKKILFGTSIK